MKRIALLASLPLLVGAGEPSTMLEIELSGLRNAKGVIQACLTAQPAHFPDCSKNPKAIKQTVPAAGGKVTFASFAPGRYAVTLFHDENGNRKLDTLMGIPREGFGFTRNPKVRFGAPRFTQVDIDLPGGFTRQTIRLQYLL